MVAPDVASVREVLAGRPELLEPGLRVHSDAQGKPVGVDFSTEVGEIELLARDGAGSYVVVMVAAPGQGEDYIAELLERMGWVRKHLATGSEKVRGILLMDQPPESLSYAAAAVADTVTFKTYRMSLVFEELRI
jgi:RecB family endonuclease NucS